MEKIQNPEDLIIIPMDLQYDEEEEQKRQIQMEVMGGPCKASGKEQALSDEQLGHSDSVSSISSYQLGPSSDESMAEYSPIAQEAVDCLPCYKADLKRPIVKMEEGEIRPFDTDEITQVAFEHILLIMEENEEFGKQIEEGAPMEFVILGFGYYQDIVSYDALMMIIADVRNRHDLWPINYKLLLSKIGGRAQRALENFYKRRLAPLIVQPGQRPKRGGAAPVYYRGIAMAANDEADYGTGFYSPYGPRVQMFQPGRVNFGAEVFMGCQCQEYLDCVVYAINAAVGFEWYQCREQVIRMLRRRMSKPKDYVIGYKARYGINVDYLKHIICDNDNVYSMEALGYWNMKDAQGRDIPDMSAEEFTRLINKAEEKAFIVLTESFEGDQPVKHAVCIKKAKQKGLVVIDSSEEQMYYTEAQDQEERWDLQLWLSRQQAIGIYTLRADQFPHKKGKNAKNPEQIKKQWMAKIEREMTGTEYDRADAAKQIDRTRKAVYTK